MAEPLEGPDRNTKITHSPGRASSSLLVLTSVCQRWGKSIVAGQPLVTLGNLETLRAETTDLDEVDVAQVQKGQSVTLAVDTFPDQVFAGRIVHIAPMAEPGTSGVNYTIEMDHMLEGMRWGITASVGFEIE